MNDMANMLPRRRWILDLSAVGALVLIALVGFWPTFGGGRFLPAAIGAILLGLGIAALSAWRRWGPLLTAAGVVAGYFLLGGVLALSHTAILGVIPTLETFRELVLGPVTAWKKLLTTVAPVAVSDGHALVPFLLALVVSVLAATLALRLRNPVWALGATLAALMLVIALGVPQPAFPLIQGLLFAVVSVVWVSLRQQWSPQNSAVSVGEIDPARASQMRWRRLAAGAAVLVVAGGTGVAVSAAAEPQNPRHVFRDVIIPPFDIREFPSPLQSFRGHVRDDAERTLFTVRGLPEGARMRVGVMDQYNGVVYNVTDGGPGTSSAFTPLRGNMSADAAGDPVTLEVEIGEYDAVWVPTAGAVREIRYAGENAEDLRRATYISDATGTAVAMGGLAAGDAYAIDAVIAPEVSDEQLATVPFGSVRMPRQSNVPESLAGLAAEIVSGAETPIQQVRALELYLAEEGFFSHGLEGEVISRAGHGSERISTLLAAQQMVGDDEQYATLMALMAREVGIPARVVMGYYPAETEEPGAVFEATGDHLHAWVEVNFRGYGWRAFDPTPPEDQVPSNQSTKPRADPKPQVLQPPPPPQEPVDLPPVLPDDREPEEEKTRVGEILGLILAIGGGVLGTLLLIMAPFILIGAWKAARRRSRRAAARTADRISGGWDELTDRAVDYGARLDPGATRGEEATTVAGTLAAPTVTALAVRADAEVFGPGEPSPEQVDAFWQEVDEIVGGIGKQAGFWRRVRARLSLRALLGGSALSRGMQGLKDVATARIRREPGTIDNSASHGDESENS